MEIQTFMTPADDKYTMKRAEYTALFMKDFVPPDAKFCLDIGESNMVGKYVAGYFGLEVCNTFGDLDYHYAAQEKIYHVVTCLEVIEHLMSPKYFLMELKKYIDENTQIFFSYPSRPHFLWTHQHFHEYDRKRFEYLLDSCGYKVVSWKRKYFPEPLKSRLRGIRPFIRQFVNFDNLVYAKLKAE